MIRKYIAIFMLWILCGFTLMGAIPVHVENWYGQEYNMVKATVLRSINNSSKKALFRPKFEEVSFLKDDAINELKMGTVFTGEFDKGIHSSSVEDNPIPEGFKERREYNVLGYDIMARSEAYNKDTEDVYADYVEGSSHINKELAIMACYKALGESYYKHEFYTSANGSYPIPVGSTPFVELVGTERTYVYPQYYYTNVFITRTVPEKYWEQARNAGLVSSAYGGTECGETVTIEDFCYMVYRMLELKGEPVLNDKETISLLVTYGSKLPQYLNGTNFEAVKYLMARGIIDDNSIDYTQNITADLAMTILMRAKDKNSRTNFKELTVEYNEDLVSKGYFPTEVVSNDKTITNARFIPQTAITDYYDYFIRICDETKFIDNEGNKLNITYIPDNSKGNSKTPYKGSGYVGTRNGYYHYRVPIDIKGSQAQCMPNGDTYCFYITAYSSNGVSKKLMVEQGGGVYNTFEKASGVESSDNSDVLLARRKPLPGSYSPIYYDQDRKLDSVNNVQSQIFLTSKQVTFKCTVEHPNEVTWKGKKISELDGGDASYDASSKELTITISKEDSSEPDNYVVRNLKTTGNGKHFPVYVKNDDNGSFLVSMSFFQDADSTWKVNNVEKIPDKDECYTIYTPNENIYVDVKNKLFVTGQSVTQLSASDTSPLIVYDEAGNSLIDYRVVTGIISGNMTLDNDNKVKSLMTASTGDYKFTPKAISSATGDDKSMNGRFWENNGKNYLYLEGGYAKSNTVVYKLNNQATSGDYLLVYTPKLGERTTSAETIKTLKNSFAVDLGEDEECTIYDLSAKQTATSGIKGKPAGISSTPCGYVYEVPKLSNFNMASYLTGGGNSPIPIVSNDDCTEFFDLNMNMIKEYGKYWYPKGILSNKFIDTFKLKHDLNMNNIFGNTEDVNFDIKSATMVLAPMAMTKVYFSPEEYTVDDILSKKTNCDIYMGSMVGTMYERTGTKVNGNKPGKVLLLGGIEKELTNETFLAISYPINGKDTFYIYKNPKGSVISDIGPASKRFTDSLTDAINGLKNYFDWDNYNFIERIKDADNWLTILNIILLSIVPYMLMLNFFVAAGFSVVAKWKIVQKFAAKFFDPLWILSWGAVTCETVQPRFIWLSCFRGAVALGLLNRQDFLSLLAWFMETVYRFSFR